MEKIDFQSCLENFLAETILECPESCITEENEKLTITIPEDKLMELLTERIRENIYNILEDEKFVDKIAESLSEKKNKNLNGKLIKDISGIILYFE